MLITPTEDVSYNLVPKESFVPQNTFSRLIEVWFKSHMELGHRTGLVDNYCSDKYLGIFGYFIIYFRKFINLQNVITNYFK